MPGACVSMSKATGMTANAINISTMPDTTGVITRRSHDSFDDSSNWNSADTITRFIMSAIPPADSARIQTAMEVAALVDMSTWPAPINPVRKDCISVMSPQTSNAAKIDQDRYCASRPAARTIMTGTSTTVGKTSNAAWIPRPRLRG